MSDLVLAEKDAETVVGEALTTYKTETGNSLAAADPRRAHLQALLLLLIQVRAMIDFAGKQSLLRYVSALFIDALAELWGEERLPALPSSCLVTFNFSSGGSHTVPAGTEVTDGTSVWAVVEDTTGSGTFFDVEVECTVAGSDSNGIAAGEIDSLVSPDDLPEVTGVVSSTETDGGRDLEGLEAYRERLRDVPESRSTCGPRAAYEAQALEASSSVADAVALGADDDVVPAVDVGEVVIAIIQGERDTDGNLISVIPTPDAELIEVVEAAVTDEEVRVLTDSVSVVAPTFQPYDCRVTYYIAESRSDSAAEIQTAVEEAFDAYNLWQQSKIGRDINPSELIRRLMEAGAKRVAVTDPAFIPIDKRTSAILDYEQLVYGGIEDD